MKRVRCRTPGDDSICKLQINVLVLLVFIFISGFCLAGTEAGQPCLTQDSVGSVALHRGENRVVSSQTRILPGTHRPGAPAAGSQPARTMHSEWLCSFAPRMCNRPSLDEPPPTPKDLGLCDSAVEAVFHTGDRGACGGSQAKGSMWALTAAPGRRREPEPQVLRGHMPLGGRWGESRGPCSLLRTAGGLVFFPQLPLPVMEVGGA